MAEFTYQGRDFLLNGEKFVVRSGAIHYFRVPSYYWRDRLLKLKECGFNTVETYVAWNLHEPKEGEFCFEGEADLARFLDTAAELGLYAIVRPGPFICAEWDFGGFPAWLLSYPNIRFRCLNQTYLEKAERYLARVFEIVLPRLITHGGNILMLQVENEYGSYGSDKKYLQALVDLYRKNGADCLLFTSDGPEKCMLDAGTHPDCLPTVNLGGRVAERMEAVGKRYPDQPLMCTEFWCGWFDYWYGAQTVRRSVSELIDCVNVFLDRDFSFNFYMFHGGTNFGFWNGATDVQDGQYNAVLTTYDYCAPLNEAGDRTDFYYAIREALIARGVDVPELTAKDSEKRAYGQVRFTGAASLFEQAEKIGTVYQNSTPLFMEDCGQSTGYILYEAKLPEIKEILTIESCKDRALVYVDEKKIGIYERDRATEDIWVNTLENPDAKIQIFVENTGRINYGPNIYGRKGIEGARFWNIHMFDWKTVSLPMDDLSALTFTLPPEPIKDAPAFYRGEFTVDEVADTFLCLDGFGKGFALVNGFNIGRYYTAAGPQKRFYVPASVLKKGNNELIVFDSDGAKVLDARFVDSPIEEGK